MTPELTNAIENWKHHAKVVADVRAVYTRAYAAGLAKSEGKNAESRKADADLAAVDHRMALELVEIEARAARWVVENLLCERTIDAGEP